MNWNEIETKWAAMTLRVRSGGAPQSNLAGKPSGEGEATGDLGPIAVIEELAEQAAEFIYPVTKE